MQDFTPKFTLNAGGWDPRFARVLAVSVEVDLAAALVDTNGDGRDIDLDRYERDPAGRWYETGSGTAGDDGAEGRLVWFRSGVAAHLTG